MKFLQKLAERITDSVFPVRCPYCDKVIMQDGIACDHCVKQFPELPFKRYAIGGYPCAAAFPYTGSYAAAIRRMKFSNRADLAKPLAAQVVKAVLTVLEDKSFDMVTCVPMHKKDCKKRGYNQAELLAKESAAVMTIPYEDTLEKCKRNKPQHYIKGKDRQTNVQGVFRLIDKKIVKDKHILLIDDIITTGNTLGECAKILYQSNCCSVSCAVVCTVADNISQKNTN